MKASTVKIYNGIDYVCDFNEESNVEIFYSDNTMFPALMQAILYSEDEIKDLIDELVGSVETIGGQLDDSSIENILKNKPEAFGYDVTVIRRCRVLYKVVKNIGGYNILAMTPIDESEFKL